MPLVALPELVEAALAGELVSFPTDTLPALAIRPDRAAIVFATKERSAQKPLILMGACGDDLAPHWHGSDREVAQWRSVMTHHWPGALTLVLPSRSPWAQYLNPQNPHTLGFRVPNHGQARAILAATGPLATTSANRSGEPALEDLGTIVATFPQVYGLTPSDPGSGQASTVAQWHQSQWQILRHGHSGFRPDAENPLS